MADGIFAEWQPVYAEAGLAAFPVDPIAKKPMVNRPDRVGLRGAGELRRKFSGAAGLGLWCGPRNKITVFDYDEPDERGFRDAMDEFGPSPFIVRSASGKFHAYYAHNGEKRMVRPDPSRKFDILGGGLVIAAPSHGGVGSYEIIQGSLADLGSLPKMRLPKFGPDAEPAAEAAMPDNSPIRAMKDGDGRNRALFKRSIAAGHSATSLEDLMQMVARINSQFAEPMSAEEVSRVASSIWGYKSEGRLFRVGGEANAVITRSEADHLLDQPTALALLIQLRMAHSNRNGKPFTLAREAASLIGVSLPTYRAARDVLVDRYFIEIIHPGGKGKNDPPMARLL